MTRVIAALAVLSCLAGCRRVPELTPRLIFQGEPVGNDFWLSAPDVLTIKVVRADSLGSRQPVYPRGPKTLQLVKFTANVENVIKGDLPDKTISFFFYVKTDGKPYYYLDPGKRYIISLRREGDVLRSFADGTQLRIWVHSGFHNQKDLPVNLGPARTIAYILLTPGVDCDLKEFAQFLAFPDYDYREPAYLNDRLKELQLSSNRMLRDAACLAAARIFSYRPECIKQCLDSSDSNTRSAAAALLEGDDLNLSGLLRNNPSALFPKSWSDYISQMFIIYSEDARPDVREVACASLRAFAPEQAYEHCDGDKDRGLSKSSGSRMPSKRD